jgi:hypothetical protein
MLLMAAMTILAGTAAGARADSTMTAKVPFDFQVGDVQMPAGDYVVSRKTEQPNAITIATSSGAHASIVLSVPLPADTLSAQPRLEFRREGGRYYLIRVVLSYADGREIAVPTGDAAAPRSH